MPFIVAQILPGGDNPLIAQINDALMRIPESVPRTACVPNNGLKDHGDGVHLDTPSQRELGRRYAEQMANLQAAQK